MAQWDKGTPALWNLGAGRGFLKIVRILTREELDDEIKAREASSEEGTTP
jgi:hypothetical protein